MASRRPWWRRLEARRPEDRTLTRHRGLAVIALAAFAVVALLSETRPWRLADMRIYDFLSTTSAPPLPPDGPVIVAIDEPSFAEIGRQWPWPRDLHARAVEALRAAGARTIGLDTVFAEPSATPQADAALAAAMAPDVVLAADETLVTTPQADQLIRVEPLPELTGRGARAGITAIALDGDGAMRRIPGYDDGFAAVLLETAGADAIQPPPDALIQSFGPARTYPTISYYQALDPESFLPPGFLRGRVVIIGLSTQSAPTVQAGGPDAYATSWTPRTGRLVAGAEIHATIFDNLAHRLFVMPASAMAGLLAILAGVLLAVQLAWRATGWRTIASGTVALLAVCAASFAMLRFGRVYMSPAAPALALVLTAAAQGARDFASERRMRRDITRVFSQYLSPVLVERLANDPSRLRLAGERRELSILFCDVRGFTTIAESMKDDPERLTALVNRLLNPLSQAVLDAGGTIDKYIGDAVMAFWNAPLDDPDHARHAVEAGLAMITAIRALDAEIAAEAEARGERPVGLRIGVGINTGDCVVGNVGSDARFDYSALGDAVNLASRLEGLTKEHGVSLLLGPLTAERVGDRLPLRALGTATVKGKTEPVAIWTVADEPLAQGDPAAGPLSGEVRPG